MRTTVKRTGVAMVGLPEVKKGSIVISRSLKNLEKGLVYWCAQSNGFLLNKVAARNLSIYLKKSLYEQKDAFAGMPKLSPDYVKWKNKFVGNERFVGIGTMTMLDSLKAIDSGYGKWKVGISGRVPPPINPGTGKPFSKLKPAQYFEIFEKGSYTQPARPWAKKLTLKWSKEQLPHLCKPVIKIMNNELARIDKYTDQSLPRYKETDLIHYADRKFKNANSR